MRYCQQFFEISARQILMAGILKSSARVGYYTEVEENHG
jgi:hypothetical protein